MVNWKKHFNDGIKLQKWLARRCSRKMDGLRDMILPVTVCACGYAHQIHMWEVHITSDNTGSDEGAVLFLSLDSESRLHIFP